MATLESRAFPGKEVPFGLRRVCPSVSHRILPNRIRSNRIWSKSLLRSTRYVVHSGLDVRESRLRIGVRPDENGLSQLHEHRGEGLRHLKPVPTSHAPRSFAGRGNGDHRASGPLGDRRYTFFRKNRGRAACAALRAIVLSKVLLGCVFGGSRAEEYRKLLAWHRAGCPETEGLGSA